MIFYEGGKPVRKRGFEVISKYKDQNINLPQRATHHAAGYDFEAAERGQVLFPPLQPLQDLRQTPCLSAGLRRLPYLLQRAGLQGPDPRR